MSANKPVRKARTRNRSGPYKTSNGSRGGGLSGRRVYVGNLSWQTDWRALKDYMRKAGPVKFADVLEYDDGKSKGCGVVEFETETGAKNAIKTLSDTDLDGRPIFVREDREPQMNSRDRPATQPIFSPHHRLAQKIRNTSSANCIVYVGNLPWSAEWQELKDICSKFGPVSRADVEQEESGRSKGFGIVIFETAKGAANCIKGLNGAEYDGRELVVKLDEIRGSGQTYGARGGNRFRSGGAKLYIGNLPWSVQWQELKDLCKQYGKVDFADIPLNEDNKSKGFGLVTFQTSRDANNCIQNLNGMLLDGRELNVRHDREA